MGRRVPDRKCVSTAGAVTRCAGCLPSMRSCTALRKLGPVDVSGDDATRTHDPACKSVRTCVLARVPGGTIGTKADFAISGRRWRGRPGSERPGPAASVSEWRPVAYDGRQTHGCGVRYVQEPGRCDVDRDRGPHREDSGGAKRVKAGRNPYAHAANDDRSVIDRDLTSLIVSPSPGVHDDGGSVRLWGDRELVGGVGWLMGEYESNSIPGSLGRLAVGVPLAVQQFAVWACEAGLECPAGGKAEAWNDPVAQPFGRGDFPVVPIGARCRKEIRRMGAHLTGPRGSCSWLAAMAGGARAARGTPSAGRRTRCPRGHA
jgi:hypothetical protein